MDNSNFFKEVLQHEKEFKKIKKQVVLNNFDFFKQKMAQKLENCSDHFLDYECEQWYQDTCRFLGIESDI